MVDTRRRNRNPRDDDNGYGEVPRGAVGLRGVRGREYPGGYGEGTGEFTGGVVDNGRGGPPDDGGSAPSTGRHRSGYGAFGDRDPDSRDVDPDRSRDEQRPLSHRGRGPKGYRRSDERIHEDVCERLTGDRLIDASNIEVAVTDGEVTLSGTVASRGLKRRAEDLAEMASGVVHVQNNLRVENSI